MTCRYEGEGSKTESPVTYEVTTQQPKDNSTFDVDILWIDRPIGFWSIEFLIAVMSLIKTLIYLSNKVCLMRQMTFSSLIFP